MTAGADDDPAFATRRAEPAPTADAADPLPADSDRLDGPALVRTEPEPGADSTEFDRAPAPGPVSAEAVAAVAAIAVPIPNASAKAPTRPMEFRYRPEAVTDTMVPLSVKCSPGGVHGVLVAGTAWHVADPALPRGCGFH